jgi:ufm1-conjugating enzyme 1
VKNNKDADNDWFRLESNQEGTRWWGKAWTIQDMLRYEFDIEFDVNQYQTFSYSSCFYFK